MRGQSEIMEYMIFVLLTMFIIIFVIFMIFGFQIIDLGGERTAAIEEKSLFVLETLLSSQTLGVQHYQKGSVLDDAVLTVMSCEDIVDMFGERVYLEIRTFIDKPNCDEPGMTGLQRSRCRSERTAITAKENVECDTNSYPDCYVWRYSGCEKTDEMVYRSVPVNVLRKMNSTVALGVMTVGIRGSEV